MKKTIHHIDMLQKLSPQKKRKQIAYLRGDRRTARAIVQTGAISTAHPAWRHLGTFSIVLDHERSTRIIRITYDRITDRTGDALVIARDATRDH
jgi:hypothetical protein